MSAPKTPYPERSSAIAHALPMPLDVPLTSATKLAGRSAGSPWETEPIVAAEEDRLDIENPPELPHPNLSNLCSWAGRCQVLVVPIG